MRSVRNKRKQALVVAFDSTASALAFEHAAKQAGLDGRLFPVPRSLSAGCGIAWRGDPSLQAQAETLLAAEAIEDAYTVIMELR